MLTLTTICLFFATVLFYVKWVFKKSRSYFDASGIPYIEPDYFFGNMKDIIIKRKPTTIAYQELYEKFEPHQIFGFFYMNTPTLVIRDPELIKTIMIKDFTHFSYHERDTFQKEEPLAYNLFTMKGDEWKTLKAKLTPSFTIAKLKLWFPLVKKCAENLKLAIEKHASSPDGIKATDLGERYIIDTIASCAFGIEVNSLLNPDSEFKIMEKRISATRWHPTVRLFFPNLPLKLVKLFGLQHFDKKASEYFIDLIRTTVQYRKENNVSRRDFLDTLMALENRTETDDLKTYSTSRLDEQSIKPDIGMTPEKMAGQCFHFLSAGLSTISITMSYLLFELAQHTEIQEKVRQEIVSVVKNNHGDLTYELLSEMSYSNMVISESMRKNPSAGFLTRMNEHEYELAELNFTIRPYTTIIIPIRGLHYDKKYYDKPNEFYPEHFTKEAIAKRPRSAYLPFGDGPRGCIGSQLARMHLLVGVISILRKFYIEVASKTKVPLEYLSGVANPAMLTRDGIWIKFRPLNTSQ